MAASAIGWYGPLINLADAASHVGSYVQLLVFVHTSRPIQRFKASNGGALLRTDICVGDDTRLYFSICVWQRQMSAVIVAGSVVLIQNVKIVKFGGAIEATTVPSSSLLHLVHSHQLLASKGIEELLAQSKGGTRTKEKLKNVLSWVEATGSKLHHNKQSNVSAFNSTQTVKQMNKLVGISMVFRRKSNGNYNLISDDREVKGKNWKVHEEKNHECGSILEVLDLAETCRAVFLGSIGEICMPFDMNVEGEFEVEKLFISKRLFMMGDSKIIQDLICSGCKLCGSPLESELMEARDRLYCDKSSNHLHDVCSIYRPFLLYVWDQSAHIPLLVKNKAAEILFGNITAESVYECYKGQKRRPDFYKIWLILLKLLLQQGKNSPFKFEITVNCDSQSATFDLVTLIMPCYSTTGVSE